MKYLHLNTDSFSLRDEQVEAITVVERYLNSFHSDKTTDQSCLVCMPTGSGKTGVFAYLARSFSHPQRPGVIVVSPRIKITKQIHTQTFSEFFETLEKSISPEELPKTGYLINSSKKELERNYKDKVFFMTIQMLTSIWFSAENNVEESKEIIMTPEI